MDGGDGRAPRGVGSGFGTDSLHDDPHGARRDAYCDSLGIVGYEDGWESAKPIEGVDAGGGGRESHRTDQSTR
ncbi:hypothetical protein CULT_1520008 [[Clostridium] ultunense Esp]|nr:hypothetical protein CULT_1520008 [[Clostridium] ultunense Esp]